MASSTKPLEVLASKRFLKAYKSASLPIQRLAEGAVHDLLRLQKSDPRKVLHRYDQLEQCNARVVEVDICGGFRLLADYSEKSLILLDLGNHEVVPRYSDAKRDVDATTTQAAPLSFVSKSKSQFFKRIPDKTVRLDYVDELSPDWLYFLVEQQQEVLDEVEEEILYSGECSAMIMGGPGTGKTCILLNLLKDLADEFNVGIVISDALAEYIEDSTGANIEQFRVDLSYPPDVDLLFVDDPSYAEILLALELKRKQSIKSVVIAFDPLQLDRPIPDIELNKLRYDNKLTVFELTHCYRQKENVGKNTKHVVEMIAESTPFLAKEKIAYHKDQFKKLTQLSNNLTFPNPSGHVEVYPEATLTDVGTELRRLLSRKGVMWPKRPGLLVVLDYFEQAETVRQMFLLFEATNYCRFIDFGQINQVKGLEYQHVFIFLRRSLFDEIHNGFNGSGQAIYNHRRLLRIPFSRAKDSLVTFAF